MDEQSTDEGISRTHERKDRYISRIRHALRQKRLVLVIGAGVTINATLRDDNRPLARTTWTGLIHDGLDYLVQEGYEDRKNRRIEEARRWLSEPDATLQDMLDAAGRLQELLQQHGQFPTWLDSVFRGLEQDVTHREILDILAELHHHGATLLTTNYDDLLDRHCKLPPIGLSNPDDLRRFKRGRDHLDGVLHVHGSYHQPDKIVLSRVGYNEIKCHDGIQSILKTYLETQTVLFVGCGDGLDDPNFHGLLKWISEDQKNLAGMHFLLLRNNGDKLYRPLLPLRYGSEYSDLPSFLRGLLEGPSVIAATDTPHGIADGVTPVLPKNEASILDEDRRKMLLDSLRFDQIDARQMNVKKAHAKTCRWFLKRSEYLDWLDDSQLKNHHGFLWIKGKPGAGKSTLMKFVFSNAQRTLKDRTIITFFFNARGTDLEKRTTGMYRSLLLQLLQQLPDLQRIYDSIGTITDQAIENYSTSEETLKELFEQAIQMLGPRPLIAFIDALDECEESQVRDMVSFFEHIGELAVSASIRFHICFSSRHYPYITIRKGLHLDLDGQEGHAQDISNYLDTELKIGRSELANTIRNEVQVKAAGIFMWVVLVVQILNKEHDSGRVHSIRRRLQSIPGDLHELFSDILTRDQHNRTELIACIQWVLFARQPLKPEQLYFAIISGTDPESLGEWHRDEISMNDIQRFLLNSSKGLVEITKSKAPTVQFIHESVKDFLLKENGLGKIWSVSEREFQAQSHESLKQCCITQMSVAPSAHLDTSRKLPKASSQSAKDIRQSVIGKFPFLEYAAQNVLFHANAAGRDGIDQTTFVRKFPLTTWISLNNLFETYEIRRHTANADLLYVLSESNASALIEVHPSNLAYLEVGFERYGTPLFAALASGNNDAVHTFMRLEMQRTTRKEFYDAESHLCSVVRDHHFGRDFNFSKRRTVLSYIAELGSEKLLSFLLRSGRLTMAAFDTDFDDDGRTPLWWAAATGREMFVQAFLATNAVNVDIEDKFDRTPLLLAAKMGHEAVVKLLLDTSKVDVDSKDKTCGQTPLSWAAEKGHEAVVKLLLDTSKVDVDSKNMLGQTPLLLAAKMGHEAVVKLLLDTSKVDVDSKDKTCGQTPLSWAAEKGHEAVVKLLLDTGKVDMDPKDKFGRTPLWWEAQYGHEAVVKLLLNTGKVDVDSKDMFGQTPLSCAACNGHKEVVKLLLNTSKVDMNSKDKTCGRTPLSWAAQNGYEVVVKLLLDTGNIDVDSEDNRGQTPLSWAVQYRNEAVVKLLLNTSKVDVNLKDSGGRTPLSWAAERVDKEVVKLLLDTGNIDVNLKDNGGQTPLSWAARYGIGAVVKLLLDTGKVDVDSKDEFGRTPLSCAVCNGHKEVVKLLLDTGNVDVDLKDEFGRTLLSCAVCNGHKEVVKLLLDTGNVDVNSKDNDGRTPLSCAVCNGRKEVVKLLLDTGNVDVNSKDNGGRTPLSSAARYGNEAVVKLLLDTSKVEVNSKDNGGRTPLSWATLNGWKAVMKLLSCAAK